MSRWKAVLDTGTSTPIVSWKNNTIIDETAHHWFRLGVPMEELQIMYRGGRAPIHARVILSMTRWSLVMITR